MYRKLIGLLFLPSIVLSNPFETTLQDEIQWLEEETFVVSASRVKENIKKTPASVTVIDSDMIEKMSAKNFLDLLNTVPGVNISQTYVYMDKIGVRGIQGDFSQKVLILLDGHSLNSDLLNGGALGAYENLPLELIKRIEIIKGPASALYGENAFSALINIITKNVEDIKGSEVALKAGKNNTKQINYLYGNRYENYNIIANFNFLDTDGDSVYLSRDSIGNSGYTDPTKENINAYLSIINNKNGLYFKGNYNSAEDGPNFGILNALNNEDLSKRKSYFTEIGLKKELTKELSLHSRIYYDYYEVKNRWEVYPEGFPLPVYTDGMLGYSYYDSQKYGIENLLTLKKENYKLVSGLSYESQSIKNPSQKMNWDPLTGAPLSSVQDFSDPGRNFISEETRKFWAVYSELLFDINTDIRMNLGARYDHYDDFGGVTNPRLGLTWKLNKNNNIKLMYGEAFRAPTFAELYNKNNPTILGNTNLEPEKVKTFELTLENSSIDDLKSSITIFNSDIEDIITLKNGQYANEGEARTQGIEAQIKYNLTRGSYLITNYTYQKTKNKQTDQELENVPTHMAYMGFNHRINKYFNLYTDIKYLSSQTRSNTDTRKKVDNSTVANLTLSAKNLIKKEMDIKLSIFNLFNEQSYDSGSVIDYPIAGRSYIVELSYKF